MCFGLGQTPVLTPTPLSIQAPGWEEVTVHTLCLRMKESYRGLEGKAAGTAQRIFVRLGVQVVPEGVPCEATLTIELTGKALSAYYIGGGNCYTGAKVSGQVTFAVPDREPLIMPIEGQVPTPKVTSDCPEEREAPFGRAWAKPVLDALADLWGYQVYVQALGDEHYDVEVAARMALEEIGQEAIPVLIQLLGDKDAEVRRAVAEVLRGIGPEAKEAVPALIHNLEDKEYRVRLITWSALHQITGQDFGEDADRWEQWWKEQ